MKLQALAAGAALAAIMAIPSAADAATWGRVTGNVNMRTCASTACQRITVVPAGASVSIRGAQGGWYYLQYAGYVGYVSGSYVAAGGAPVMQPQRPPAPTFGYYQKPWWDGRHNAWYDGHRWWHNGRWYDQPSGFFLGFSFGG